MIHRFMFDIRKNNNKLYTFKYYGVKFLFRGEKGVVFFLLFELDLKGMLLILKSRSY